MPLWRCYLMDRWQEIASLYQRLTTPTSTTSITAIVTINTMRAAIICAIFLAIIVTVIEGESGRRREMERGRRQGLRPRERKVVRRKVGAEKTSGGETGRRSRKQMRRGRKLERVQQGRQGIVVKGNDCEFIYLADITSNSGCSNGQKFVLKVRFCSVEFTNNIDFLGGKQHTQAVLDCE